MKVDALDGHVVAGARADADCSFEGARRSRRHYCDRGGRRVRYDIGDRHGFGCGTRVAGGIVGDRGQRRRAVGCLRRIPCECKRHRRRTGDPGAIHHQVDARHARAIAGVDGYCNETLDRGARHRGHDGHARRLTVNFRGLRCGLARVCCTEREERRQGDDDAKPETREREERRRSLGAKELVGAMTAGTRDSCIHCNLPLDEHRRMPTKGGLPRALNCVEETFAQPGARCTRPEELPPGPRLGPSCRIRQSRHRGAENRPLDR